MHRLQSIALLLAAALSLACCFSSEDRLVSELQKRLGSSGSVTRPVQNGRENSTVSVSFGLSPLRLSAMISELSSARLEVWIRMIWTDPRLGWDPAEYGGLSQVSLPTSMIWIPDIRVIHAGGIALDDSTPVQAVVFSSSDVHYVLPAVLRLPTDRLRNESRLGYVSFGSWTRSSFQIDLRMADPVLDLDNYQHSPNWQLVHAYGDRVAMRYSCCPEEYISIDYRFMFNPIDGSERK